MFVGRRCFQLIGFDVMLSAGGDPYVIEINHNPSFKLPTPLDEDIKTAALAGAVALASDFPMSSKAPGAKVCEPLPLIPSYANSLKQRCSFCVQTPHGFPCDRESC